jgi:hypothetical protein
MNRASNNLEDSLASSMQSLQQSTNPAAAVLAVNALLTAMATGLEGYQRQISELVAPKEIPEAVELLSSEQATIKFVQGAVQEMRAAIQSGSPTAIQGVTQKLQALDTDPTVNKGYEIEKALLQKYNIPDAEVGFRRSR